MHRWWTELQIGAVLKAVPKPNATAEYYRQERKAQRID